MTVSEREGRSGRNEPRSQRGQAVRMLLRMRCHPAHHVRDDVVILMQTFNKLIN